MQVKKAQSLASAGQTTVENFDTDKVVSSVKVVSPSLASLLALTLSQAGLKGSGKDAVKGGKEACEFAWLLVLKRDACLTRLRFLRFAVEAAKKQIETLTETLKSTSPFFFLPFFALPG